MSEAALLGFLLLAGLGLGAVLCLALGRLLDDAWLLPLHRPLALLTLALPAAAALAPLAPLPGGALQAWALLAGWGLAGWLLATRLSRRIGGAALALALFSGALAMGGWAAPRGLPWFPSVGGTALVAAQAAAALGLAILRAGAPAAPEARTGLERMALSLALACLWLGFTQYLVAWAADLPAEAAWHARRDGAWWGVSVAALGALLLAVALGAVPQWRPWRLRAVAALLVLHHAAQLPWLLRPDAAQPATAADALLALLLLPLVAWWRAAR